MPDLKIITVKIEATEQNNVNFLLLVKAAADACILSMAEASEILKSYSAVIHE